MKLLNIILKLIGCIVLSQLAGIVGAFSTTSSVKTWYPLLIKPSFNPPSWVFGPVWTILFTLMGIALFLIIKDGMDSPIKKTAIVLFLIQLILNALWSYLFFGLRSPLLGLIEIFVLWIFILGTIISFFKVSKPAGYLMVPYILWVSFAIILNYSIYSLNK